MEIIAIDIETIPHQSLPGGCRPEFNASEVKTGNAGAEKAQLKIEKERIKFEETLTKKMSTSPTLCQVCTFCGMLFDTETDEIKDKVSIQISEEIEDDEYECIHDAWNFIRKSREKKIPLVTFNGIGFDVPVLIFRAMALDIPIPMETKNLLKKYEARDHYDLMQLLAHWDRQGWQKLDFYLKLFRIGKKLDDMDGSKVYAAWQAKEFDKIKAYCENDVFQLCELFQRVESWIK